MDQHQHVVGVGVLLSLFLETFKETRDSHLGLQYEQKIAPLVHTRPLGEKLQNHSVETG